MEYFMKALGKGKTFLFEPAKAFKKEGKTNFGEAFKYLLVLGIINAVLGGIVVGAFSMNAIALVGAIVGIYVTLVIGALIGGIILHIFAYIVGARGGFEQTFKATFYGQTPTLLLGWIPAIGGIFVIWSIVLQIIGIRDLHKISTGRAVLAVLLPIIIIGIAVLLLAVALMSVLFAGGGIGIPGMDMTQLLATVPR